MFDPVFQRMNILYHQAQLLSTDNGDTGRIVTVHEHLSLLGSGEVVGSKLPIFGTLPNPLDEFRAEETIVLNANNLANHVAVVDAIEVQALNNVAYLHFPLRYLTV
jgi:hypothetical protein